MTYDTPTGTRSLEVATTPTNDLMRMAQAIQKELWKRERIERTAGES